MGRRNLLTTASSGSATGLQVISDRLADNFSILPGHHGSGDKVDGGDGDGRDGAEDDGAKAKADRSDGGAWKSNTFAMFECPTDGARRAQSPPVRTSGGRAREAALSPSLPPSFSLSLCQSVACLFRSVNGLCRVDSIRRIGVHRVHLCGGDSRWRPPPLACKVSAQTAPSLLCIYDSSHI